MTEDFCSFCGNTIGADLRVSGMKRNRRRLLSLPGDGSTINGMDVAEDGAQIQKVLRITRVIEAKEVITERDRFLSDDVCAIKRVARVEKGTMRMRGKVATNLLETLKSSSSRSSNVFSQATHGVHNVKTGNIREIK